MPVLYWFSRRMSLWGTISFNLAVFINLIIAFFYPYDSGQGTVVNTMKIKMQIGFFAFELCPGFSLFLIKKIILMVDLDRFNKKGESCGYKELKFYLQNLNIKVQFASQFECRLHIGVFFFLTVHFQT